MNINRRDFIKYGMAGLGASLWPFQFSVAKPADDHYLFILFLDGGADFTYLFDARPLEMTQNKLLSNRMGQPPRLWQGANGGQTWASALTTPLETFKNDFSVVNGVFMDKTFAGHNNMIDLIFSGNALGGESFLPWINSKNTVQPPSPLDGIKKNSSFFFADPHHTSLIELESEDAAQLISKLKQQPFLSKKSSAWDYSLARMQAGGLLDPNGQWSQGSQKLFDQTSQAQNLAAKLGSLDMSSLDPDIDLNFLDLFNRMVQQKMIRVGLDVTAPFDPKTFQLSRFQFDSHAIGSDAEHILLYQNTVSKIAATLNYFKNTAYDSQRSLLDVTTFVVATEFGRTMRQEGQPIETCGTDHNIFCNSFLFAGQGIRGGQVIGASDFQSSQETLSPAHLALDEKMLNIMAKPFDFSTEKPLEVLPSTFEEEHYLTSGSIMNTLFDVFSMPKDIYRRKNTGSMPYKSIRSLLK